MGTFLKVFVGSYLVSEMLLYCTYKEFHSVSGEQDNKEDGGHVLVYLTKESNQNSFVLDHQYGGYDVIYKRSLSCDGVGFNNCRC